MLTPFPRRRGAADGAGGARARAEETEALAKVGSWQLELSGGVMTCSAQLRELCGLPPDAPAPSGAAYAALVHPHDRPRVVAGMQALAASGTPFVDEHRLVVDGRTRHVRASGAAETDARGRVVRIWGATQDVTELRASEQALRLQQDRSSALLAALSDGYAFSVDGVAREVNDAFCALTGYSRQDLLGSSAPFPFWPPDQLEAMREVGERLRRQEEEVETTWRRADGAPIRVALTTRPVRDPDGGVLGYVTLTRDVTARARELEELAHSQRLLAEAQRQAQLGSWEMDVVSGAMTWSPEMHALGGLDEGPVSVAAVLERVHPADRAAYVQAFEEALSTGGTHAFEHRVVHLDGSVHHISGTALVELDPTTGKAVRMRGSARDVTDERRREFRSRTQTAHLRAAAAGSHAILTDPSPRDAICRAAGDVAGAMVVTLLEVDGTSLTETASSSTVEHEPVRRSLTDTASLLVQVQRSGQPVVVEDTRRHAVTDLPGAHSAICVPVLAGVVHSGAGDPPAAGASRRVLGVLAATLPAAPEGGGLELLRVLQVLAADAGIAIERADLQRRLAEQARTDGLTGLPNRRTWDAELPLELARAARSGAPLSVAILDLDHFKAYNDAFGHGGGDRLLSGAATAWSGLLRATDLLARYGGEEFVLALPDCSLDHAARLLDRLRAATPAGATVSVGLTAWDGQESADAVVARADLALYEAKHRGRDRVCTLPPGRLPVGAGATRG